VVVELIIAQSVTDAVAVLVEYQALFMFHSRPNTVEQTTNSTVSKQFLTLERLTPQEKCRK
jgi:hypothetical protein